MDNVIKQQVMSEVFTGDEFTPERANTYDFFMRLVKVSSSKKRGVECEE